MRTRCTRILFYQPNSARPMRPLTREVSMAMKDLILNAQRISQLQDMRMQWKKLRNERSSLLAARDTLENTTVVKVLVRSGAVNNGLDSVYESITLKEEVLRDIEEKIRNIDSQQKVIESRLDAAAKEIHDEYAATLTPA